MALSASKLQRSAPSPSAREHTVRSNPSSTTSAEPRRRWSAEEKRRIVAAAIEPGAVVSEVARAAGIPVSQLFHWRKQLCGPAREKPGFAAVTVAPSAGSSNMIEVEFANGARLRITGATDGAIVSAMIKALAKGTGRR
jgi:transposase